MYRLTNNICREIRRKLLRGRLFGWRLTAWNILDIATHISSLIFPSIVLNGIIVPADIKGNLKDYSIKGIILKQVGGSLNVIAENKKDYTVLTIRIPK